MDTTLLITLIAAAAAFVAWPLASRATNRRNAAVQDAAARAVEKRLGERGR